MCFKFCATATHFFLASHPISPPSPLPPPPSQGCQRNTEDWQRILQVRSIVLSQQEEIQSWVKFASICRKSDKMALSERTLRSILSHDPTCNQEQPISEKYPQVCVQCVCSHQEVSCLPSLLNFSSPPSSSSLLPPPLPPPPSSPLLPPPPCAAGHVCLHEAPLAEWAERQSI